MYSKKIQSARSAQSAVCMVCVLYWPYPDAWEFANFDNVFIGWSPKKTTLFLPMDINNLFISQFHTHVQSLKVTNSGGPLDNQTWQTEWKTAPLAKVQLCDFGSFCCSQLFVYQVWLSSGPTELFTFSYCAWVWNRLIDWIDIYPDKYFTFLLHFHSLDIKLEEIGGTPFLLSGKISLISLDFLVKNLSTNNHVAQT